MRFDNKNFETNAATSINTLEKLNNSLALKGATKGLEDVDAAARRVDVSPIGSAVDKVGLKFSAMYSIADQALRNITNSAMATGKRLISAFTIDPLKSGFSEYELKMGSIQTIMAGTGEDLETVNKYLNELNTYSDKTIYSFSDMTQNIGKFTNAGVKLEDAVAAIQGISNAAAVSGANSNEASRAMYNFSQALSAGYVKLIDWKSIENANMATVEFKNQLIDTAVEMGVVTKASDGMYKTASGKTFNATKNFNEVLQEQWMTSDVLIKTLGKYSDETTEIGKKAFQAATEVKTFSQMMDTLKESAQSGWAQTWEIIFGDFNEGKGLWTDISNIFGNILESSAKTRNELLENWKVMGGRDDLLGSFANIVDSIKSIIKPIKEAFKEIFPPMTAKKLADLTATLRDLTRNLIISEDTADKLKRTFKGVFALVDIGVRVFKALAGVAIKIFKALQPVGEALLGVSAGLGDTLVAFRDFVTGESRFLDFIDSFGDGIADAVRSVFDMTGMLRPLSRIVDAVQVVFDAFRAIFDKIKPVFVMLWNFIKSIFKVIGDEINKFTKNPSMDALLELFSTGLFYGLIIAIINKVRNIADFLESVKGVLDIIKDSFEEFTKAIKANAIMKIAIAIGILAVALIALTFVDPDKLGVAIAAITGMFLELIGALLLLEIIDKKYGAKMNSVSSTLIGLSIAVLIIASALKRIADIDEDALTRSVITVGALIAALAIASKYLSDSKTMSMVKGLRGIIFLAAGLYIIVGALEKIAKIDAGDLWKSLGAIALLLLGIAVFINEIDDAKFGVGKGVGLVLLATSLVILASAIEKISKLSWEEIAKGLVTIAAALGVMFVALKFLPKGSLVNAAALAVIMTSLLALAGAMKLLGMLSWEEIAKGFVAMSAALGTLFVALKFLPKTAIINAAALTIAISSLVVLAGAMKLLGKMTWGEIARGLVVLAGSLIILATALHAISGSVVGALVLPIAAAGLLVLAGAMKALGSMSWGEILKGLVTLAGTFVILGVAAAVLSPLVPTILLLATAITMFGIACLAVGVGMLAFSAGLSVLALTGVAGAKALAAIILTVAETIPMIFVKLAEGIILFAKVVTEGMPHIAAAIMAIVDAILDVLLKCIPKIVEIILTIIVKLLEALDEYLPIIADAILKVIVALINKLAEYAPKLVDAIFDFIIGILNGVAERTPELVKAFVNIIMGVFQGVVDALSGVDPEVLKQGLVGVGILTSLVAALALIAPLIPGAIIGALGLGLVVAELGVIFSALGLLAQLPGLTWLINEGGDLMQAVGTALGKFVGGIVGGFGQGVSSALPQIGSDLSAFMANAKPFIEGSKRIDVASMEGAKALASIILTLTAANILDGIGSWITGGSSMINFAEQLVPFGEAMVLFSAIVAGNIDEGAVTAAANAGKIMADMAKTLPNSGGVVGFFAGNNDLDTFAAKLVPFGNAITQFSSIVAGKIDESAVTAAANAGKAMAEMADTIPNSGGVVGFFAGNNDIDTFATKLVPFGMAITQFSKIVTGKIDEGAVAAASSAGLLMAQLQTSLPGTNGVVQFFTGEQNLAEFAAGLVPFGKAMVAFSKEVSGKIDEGAVTAAATAGKALAEMNNALPKTGGLKELFGGNKDMDAFSEGIVAFGKGLKNYSKEVVGINSSALTTATKAVKDLVSLAKSMSGVDFGSFGSFGKELGNIGKDGIDKFIKAFSDTKDKVIKAGNTMVENLIKGVKDKSGALDKAVTKIVNDAAVKLEDGYDSFYEAGAYLVDGFADGIKQNTYKASAKAVAMAEAAKLAAEEALGIASPSKVGYGIGNFFGIGFVNAIDDSAVDSYKASSGMAESARKGLSEAIRKAAEVIESDIDAQPTIRPVLDLSDIKSGAGAISSMLDIGSSVGVTANVGAINSMMNRRSQNGGTEDVVSAIDKLNKNLGNVGGTSYSIGSVTYDDGTNVAEAIKTIIQAAKVERRV